MNNRSQTCTILINKMYGLKMAVIKRLDNSNFVTRVARRLVQYTSKIIDPTKSKQNYWLHTMQFNKHYRI